MTKTETDINLLEESIIQWEAKTNGNPLEDHECPLCDIYDDWNCTGCPIKAETGDTLCVGSPYNKWSEANDNKDQEATLIAVYLELEFLYLLLSSHYDKLGEGK